MMGRNAAAAVAAAADGNAAAMPEVPSTAVRQGVVVTLGFFVLYYAFLLSQGTMKRKLRAYYAAQGKKFDRYFSREKNMLLWDRTVGNMLEQSPPFLTLFWLSIFLSERGGMWHGYVVWAGWLYIALRSLYPLFWLSGGGNMTGTTSTIWKVTIPMYMIIVLFAGNVTYAITFTKRDSLS